MARWFIGLTPDERRDVLDIAAEASDQQTHLIEKDIWVVWVLNVLCSSALGESLIFKGGTSLSKAYGFISRFSEDVDMTYDIRKIAPEFVEGKVGEFDVEPPSKSQASKWTNIIREQLPQWIEAEVKPIMTAALQAESITPDIAIDGHKMLVNYDAVAGGYGYVTPSVLLEFGARSTGEPTSPRDIKCDADGLVEGVAFPTAHCPRVMHAERTFWEKATAVHVFCKGGKGRGPRFSRHFHDLMKLDDAGVADRAIADKALAESVAKHKSMFFAEKTAGGEIIDYSAAVGGGLCLVPDDEGMAQLRDDYEKMADSGLLLEEAEPLDGIIERCAGIAGRANG